MLTAASKAMRCELEPKGRVTGWFKYGNIRRASEKSFSLGLTRRPAEGELSLHLFDSIDRKCMVLELSRAQVGMLREVLDRMAIEEDLEAACVFGSNED